MGKSDEEIKYVRDNFEREYADKISSDSYDDRDLRRLRTDDVYVTTFIRGPSRLQEGVNLVHESLKFRKEFGVNDLTEDSFEQWMWDKHAIFYHGRSKTGHKILFVRVKEHKKDASQLLLVKKFVVFWLEMSFRANPLDPIITMFDMTDAGLSNLDMEFIRFILTCFKLYYPTFLEKLLIYEMPWIFNAAWKVIKTWLSAEAIAKIKFATRSDIHTYIDTDQLFEHMGGTCDLDSVDYYPQHSEDGAVVFSDPTERRKVTFSESTESQTSRQCVNLNNNAANHCLTSPRPARHQSNNSSGSEGSSFAGRLLTISPADELVFVVDEQTKEAFDVITLTNTLMYPIAFKVKTTAPEKYRVRPSTGVVKPGEAFEVYVYLQPDIVRAERAFGYINTVEKDKFLVMAMEVTGDNYDTSLWKTAPKDTIMEHRLRCVAPSQVDFNVNLGVEGEGSKGRGVRGSALNVSNHHGKTFVSSHFDSQNHAVKSPNRNWSALLPSTLRRLLGYGSDAELPRETSPYMLHKIVSGLPVSLWSQADQNQGNSALLQHNHGRPHHHMEMLIESNRQLRRSMRWLIVSHIVFFVLTMIFFAAFFCLGEDLFSSYLYFPFGYCVSSSWSRRC